MLYMPSPSVVKVISSFHARSQPSSKQASQSLDQVQASVDHAVDQHYTGMVSTFRKFQHLDGMRRGIVFEKAIKHAIKMAARRSRGVVIIGKDITLDDSKGKSTWWNDAAGPGPKLWRWAHDWVSLLSICLLLVLTESDARREATDRGQIVIRSHLTELPARTMELS